MRIILFAGKGGVGKTSTAAATGLLASQQGYRTIVLSLDSAHSLADAFDVDKDLMDLKKGLPFKVAPNLWIQEIDVQEEIERHWHEVHHYVASLFRSAGLQEVLAEELAILPGTEEVSGLLYVNSYARKEKYDLIILDCAPTGESIRFVSLPTIFEWYMKKFFKLEKRITKLVRPVVERVYNVPLPRESQFDSIEALFDQLDGVQQLLTDPKVTSVRLVTNPEKIVIKETQRAFLYFSLYGLGVDGVIVNKLFPSGGDGFLSRWERLHQGYLSTIREYFSPIPVFSIGLFREEVVGKKALEKMGKELYGDKDPAQVFYAERPYEFSKKDGYYQLEVRLPFITKKEVELRRRGEELIIEMGAFRRHVLLPRNIARLPSKGAKIEGKRLIIKFGGGKEDGQRGTEEAG